MANKQICPHCGLKFVNLSRHKCKVAPPKEETKTKAKKKAIKKPKSNVKKKSSQNSTKTETAEKSRIKENSKKKSSIVDKEILSLIENKKLIYQDEIIELAESKFDIDVKNVEKSLFRLANRQKITIQSDLRGGIRKDRIDFIEDYEIKDKSSMKKKGDLAASWDIVDDCPCFLCPEVIKCNVGNNSYSVSVINREKQILTNPYYCSYIKRWLDCKVSEIPVEYKNPFKGGAYFGKKKKKKARASSK